jgi:SagB-type dehydrogenase family enzyme
MRLRRARNIVMYWRAGEVIAENYLELRSTDLEQAHACAIDTLAVELLSCFDDWTAPEDVADALDDYDRASVLESIEQLRESGLLRDEGNVAREGPMAREWRDWGHEAGFYHFSTKDAVYTSLQEDLSNPAGVTRLIAEEGRPPEIFKTYPAAPRLWLPRVYETLTAPFGDVLVQRRTHREFAATPVALDMLSTVLFYTFAPMRFVDAHEFGMLQLRTSPAAGALHELECYVGVLSVAGIEPGMYHYCSRDHALERLSTPFSRELVERLTFGQRMCVEAGFICVVSAVFRRMMYKYRHPRAYRLLLLDAGHLGQTFVLTCTALGLGAFQTAAFRDTEVEQALGLDGFSEGALYVLGAGRPFSVGFA